MTETKPMRNLQKGFPRVCSITITSLIHRPYCTFLLVTTLTHSLQNTLATRTPICGGTTHNTRHVHGPQQGQQSEAVPYRTPGLFMAPNLFFSHLTNKNSSLERCITEHLLYMILARLHEPKNMTWPEMDSKVLNRGPS